MRELKKKKTFAKQKLGCGVPEGIHSAMNFSNERMKTLMLSTLHMISSFSIKRNDLVLEWLGNVGGGNVSRPMDI